VKALDQLDGNALVSSMDQLQGLYQGWYEVTKEQYKDAGAQSRKKMIQGDTNKTKSTSGFDPLSTTAQRE
jgi:hypothetical protein